MKTSISSSKLFSPKRIMRFVAGLAVTSIIFIFIFRSIKPELLIAILGRCKLFQVGLALLLLLAATMVRAQRWQVVLRVMGCRISYFRAFRQLMASSSLDAFLPSKTSDFYRSYSLCQSVSPGKSVGAVLTERLFDVTVLLMISGISGIALNYQLVLAHFVPGLLIIIGLVLVFFYSLRIIRRSLPQRLALLVVELGLSFYLLWQRPTAFARVALSTFLCWVLAMLQVLLFFRALNISAPTLFILAATPVAIFAGMLPITLGGMGTRDAAFICLFAKYAAAEELLGVGLLFSLVRYIIPCLLGIPFLLADTKNRCY